MEGSFTENIDSSLLTDFSLSPFEIFDANAVSCILSKAVVETLPDLTMPSR